MATSAGKEREQRQILKNLVALILILGCLWASQWQFQRGIDRHDRNSQIKAQLQLPTISLDDVDRNLDEYEWRSVKTSGTFDTGEQILLKNRYFEGVYGYEVLTRFEMLDGRMIWVDRGWVKAGKDALTPPVVTAVPAGQVDIQARLRLDRSLPQGAFFALPSNAQTMISKLNAQSSTDSEGFYLDLINGSIDFLTPAAPAQVPELSDGPHLAYSLQWIFFAGLVIYGRILIRRGQILTGKELRVEPASDN
ncbi:MAG: SURF1 family protein [Candidatus Planktophila sp.]